MTITFAVLTALLSLAAIALPFFVGRGGVLAAASSLRSKEQLQKIKLGLAKRYVQDQQAFTNKDISKRAWEARREFLLRRFIDTSRRLDYLEHIENSQS